MKQFVIFILGFVVVTVIGTVMIGRKGDEHYSKATKGNIRRLTMIYLLLAAVLTVGLGLYIYFYG
ncbi:hypothetical protein ACO11K_002231 [Bacillus cytotoxicus]|uniref:hypothetical protein n=1 Tax=Bacillus cereus group sp. BfR-BA-01492 TaxID=2920361 RepID=UPI001F57356F|nr:hypothetical protein [Bacillus cereus group sp. BfR-BA-01492]EMA6343461.1 hypothetical protein [Bacillus cytotoxicus]